MEIRRCSAIFVFLLAWNYVFVFYPKTRNFCGLSWWKTNDNNNNNKTFYLSSVLPLLIWHMFLIHFISVHIKMHYFNAVECWNKLMDDSIRNFFRSHPQFLQTIFSRLHTLHKDWPCKRFVGQTRLCLQFMFALAPTYRETDSIHAHRGRHSQTATICEARGQELC